MKRIYHPWHVWECYKAGMWATSPPKPMTPDDALQAYATFLRDTPRFQSALDRVTTEWPTSCEQFLSNDGLNRVAWLGQSSMCIATGVPAVFRGGFKLLTDSERSIANATAQNTLDMWLKRQQKSRSIHQGLGALWVSRRHTRRGAGRAHAPRFSSILQGDLFRAA